MIVIINGPGGSGKDTFVELCSKYMEPDSVGNFSTVDLVKKYARAMGWDGIKNEKNRKFLSDLKDALEEWNEAPTYDVIHNVYDFLGKKHWLDTPDKALIFIHCREPEQIEKLVKYFSSVEMDVTTLFIKRDNIKSYQNHADSETMNYAYDYIVENNGTFEELSEAAERFVRELNEHCN